MTLVRSAGVFLQEEGYQPQSILSLLALAGGAITINPNVVKEFGVTLESAAEHVCIHTSGLSKSSF